VSFVSLPAEPHDVPIEPDPTTSSGSGTTGLIVRAQRVASERGLPESSCLTRVLNPVFAFPLFTTVCLYINDKALETCWLLAGPVRSRSRRTPL
jgi:hypothetical protein